MIDGYDFGGWATRNNMRCSDGRTILKDAFKENDGKKVPLVWNHNHTTPGAVLGHALLKNMEDGVYAYCFFNNTQSGREAKEAVKHGDIVALSIYANQLREQAKSVIHGMIREVSLVLAGANPGAFIDSVIVHSDGSVETDYTQGTIYTGMVLELAHSEEENGEDEKAGEAENGTEEGAEPAASEGEIEHADDEKKADDEKSKDDEEGETLGDIFETLTDKQQIVVMGMLEEAIRQNAKEEKSETNSDENEEETEMKHNLFDKETENTDAYLSHADGVKIVELAKSYGGGSLKAAMDVYIADNKKELAHSDLGFNNISTLFPDYKDVKPGAPDMLTTDQGWISKVLAKVHKSPISRIRTRQADVRDISGRRAKGYKKGTQKTDAGNVDLLERTTESTTVFIRSKLDRDDIVDIVDFDVVAYMYGLDRMNLNEELARQIMIGDGRTGDNAIDKTKIRPIWLDDELYTIHRDVDIAAMRTSLQGTNTSAYFGENYIYAEAIIETLLYAREKYKGSGNPDFYCTPHLVNVMLLARDMNGRRIYDNVNELKAALNVNEIITAEQFAGQTRTTVVAEPVAGGGTQNVEHTKELLGIMVNLADYSLGATKGGEITHFTDFDLNFNQQISLLETRCSGANTRPLSAIALELDVTDDD